MPTYPDSHRCKAPRWLDLLDNSFSQHFFFSQHSRNLHKIFTQLELWKVNRILSKRLHRKWSFCDEKEDREGVY